MKLSIIVDSGCDLFSIHSICEKEVGFYRVPFKLCIDQDIYTDDKTIPIKRMMQQLSKSRISATSIPPSVKDWKEAFLSCEDVIAITTTKEVSESYHNAMEARRILLQKQQEKKIYVLNSNTASAGISLLVLYACELIMEKTPIEEIYNQLEHAKAQMGTLFLIESFDRHVKNKKLDKIIGEITGKLNVRFIGRINEEGNFELLKHLRKKVSSYQELLARMKEAGFCGGKVIISHCFYLDRAKYLKRIIISEFPESEVYITVTSGLCSYYIQQGGIIIGFEKDNL